MLICIRLLVLHFDLSGLLHNYFLFVFLLDLVLHLISINHHDMIVDHLLESCILLLEVMGCELGPLDPAQRILEVHNPIIQVVNVLLDTRLEGIKVLQ